MSQSKTGKPVPVYCVPEYKLDTIDMPARHVTWAGGASFTGQRGQLLRLPGEKGETDGYLFGMGDLETGDLVTGLAAQALPAGHYKLAGNYGDPTKAALGFKLGAYRYDRYRPEGGPVTIANLPHADMKEVELLAEAASYARDLINTPPNDLGPDAFEDEVREFAKARKMTFKSIVGDELLKQGFNMIHAVGRASAEAPRLIDLGWGAKSDPKITLVGKGVTFDTGGLDIKPAAGMLLMKKDMGGAANVLGLAHAIVSAGLKVRLRVLLPIVENAISGSAFRPGDVLKSKAGLTVEIGNTDAEGRLILADALSLAGEEKPELLVDMATLTGAARVALGPELPPIYATDTTLGEELVAAGMAQDDPLWQMPLWAPYDRMLNSRIADISHISQGGFAGSITAALFLKRFIGEAQSWVHMDIFGWAPEQRQGRSFGGADQGIRALYKVLKEKYPS